MGNEFFPLFYTFTFYVFGLGALVSSLMFVTRRSPVSAAMWLVLTMFALAALYVMLDAQFVGTMQVLVYAGAIMVVFLFVVMLLNLGHPSEMADIRGTLARLAAGVVGVALVAEVMTLTAAPLDLRLIVPVVPVASVLSGPAGVIGPIAAPMFKEYLLAFELTSVLLLVAIIGAVVIGKKGR